jgi:hypothetical protein
MPANIFVALLHDRMYDKQGQIVTTSLTMIDLHDMARSCRTYDVENFYVAHPAAAIRKLAQTLRSHWETGFGATYNPNRKEALDHVQIVCNLDEAIGAIDTKTGKLPKIIATSAKAGPNRIKFGAMRELLADPVPYLLLFGTGWGMSDEILSRADYFLEPVNGPGEYNHLSVRSACAIILDRLLGRQ